METIDKNRRIIWTNNDFEEWKKAMIEDGYSDDEADYSSYTEDCEYNLYDERANLDVKVDGIIVCFAILGLWDGKHNAARTFGNYVKKILSSDCEYTTWFCDRYNVRCEAIHHDGTNMYLYRVAKNEDEANKLVNKIAYENMTEEEFRKATRSLRPYVAKVYGW